MNSIRKLVLILALFYLIAWQQPVSAQHVEARLSSREAYVGMPIVLQISITNASDFEPPALPEIDGCDIRSAGSPAQRSQITIINGRRSDSRSVTMQYLITPRRAGSFEIPALSVRVDGVQQKTPPLRFVATKSDTGDLLFVEIEGAQKKVFVGQPLDLKLKIWIKPFADRARNIKLSEANMWQLISQQTSWGSFADRLREMAENNQRPAGKEDLRDNGEGTESSYYLYEIESTIYPKRPGKIDADDVQIVVNYPTEIGKSREPFEDFFKDSPLGGGSPLSRLMDDDFFASPFGNRLSITSARPIVGEATVDATEVIPVPTAGRPDDYRGAVGRYKIATQAAPHAVNAGDPITLNIGITGTGPMELVQAPPLATLPALIHDFKVTDQSLAGFVQGDTKLFSTSIRPRREGIAQIPPIPFSFFDPETESFQTVLSDPISISVHKSESLALDAIVGNPYAKNNDRSEVQPAASPYQPDLTNHDSAGVLISQANSMTPSWWLVWVIGPPVLWLVTLLISRRHWIMRLVPEFRSAASICESKITRATTVEQITKELVGYVANRLKIKCVTSSEACGALRTDGHYQLANEIESFLQRGGSSVFNVSNEQSLGTFKPAAIELLHWMEASLAAARKPHVQRNESQERPDNNDARRKRSRRRDRPSLQRTTLLVIGVLLMGGKTTDLDAGPTGHPGSFEQASTIKQHDSAAAESYGNRSIQLSGMQRQTILNEATEIYNRANTLAESDSAEAKEQFSAATKKYQLLVDAGIHNSLLYLNLGNAYLQTNQLGRAIANYERAKSIDPSNRQIADNLEFANSKVKQLSDTAETKNQIQGDDSISFASIRHSLQAANQRFAQFIGVRNMIVALAIASVMFWGVLIVATLGYRFPWKSLAVMPLLILILTGLSFGLTISDQAKHFDGVIIADNVTIFAGDGEQFDQVVSLDSAQGNRIRMLARRGNWTQIQTATGDVGWITNGIIETIGSPTSSKTSAF